MRSELTNAPTRAAPEIHSPLRCSTMMPAAAKRDAPALTPTKSGDANGLRSMRWNSGPARPRRTRRPDRSAPSAAASSRTTKSMRALAPCPRSDAATSHGAM